MHFIDPVMAAREAPAGRWAIAVSGGADSVALLHLLLKRADMSLHVVHLDHETRGPASAGDARFVQELAAGLGLACTIERRSNLEPAAGRLPRNVSSRFRRLRLALFQRVVETEKLDGVLLAHHADDVAETVLARILRGSGPRGLTGIGRRTRVAGVLLYRPLLSVRGRALREYLRENHLPWREDASNASPVYLRNRLRKRLACRSGLAESLLDLAAACAALRSCVDNLTPTLPAEFHMNDLADLPSILAEEAARRWLLRAKVPAARLTPGAIRQLVEMANDAASASTSHFPGQLLVRRRRSLISASKRHVQGPELPSGQV